MADYQQYCMHLDTIIKALDTNVKAKENNAKTDYEKGYLQALNDVMDYFIAVKANRDRLAGGGIRGYGHDC